MDQRFFKSEGREVFTGNELLVKGALECPGGVHLFTGYPGSPISSFFNTLGQLSAYFKENGQVTKIANNEALSVAMVNGSQMVGCRAITAFKSVGLHVASDALALGILAGTLPANCETADTNEQARQPGRLSNSGGLIICGDDPWNESTQVPADSRYLAEHLRLPMIEPSSPQEVKDWIRLAFEIGEAGQIYVGFCMTTALADGGGSVTCYPNHTPEFGDHQPRALKYETDILPNLEDTVLLPPRTGKRETLLTQRLKAVTVKARELGVNRIIGMPQKGERAPIGVIAAGNSYAFMRQALNELNIATPPILKLGLLYPLDDELTRHFAESCEQILVIEERRGFVEKHVISALSELNNPPPIYGKSFPDGKPGFPETGGLNPSILIEKLSQILQTGRKAAETTTKTSVPLKVASLPTRTPTFCPGCPHRDSSDVLLELRKKFLNSDYMLSKHKRRPVDLISHGDTGCYTMLMFEPNQPLMHNYSGMGLGGGTGLGVDPFIENKQIVFMGDGTFFHSGMTAISQSVYNKQDITYIILDNETMAMTGHQVNAGDQHDLRGDEAQGQDIEKIARSMAASHKRGNIHVYRMDPSDREQYLQLLEGAILAEGVKVIIAQKPCAIADQRIVKQHQQRVLDSKGYLPKQRYMNIATEVCENCLECTRQTGCTGLKMIETDYGPKIQTDLSWCVNDGACQRIDACPSFEEITIRRKQRARQADEHFKLDDIPDAPRPIHADQEVWRCFITGVGGMGIGVLASVLVRAGHSMGYEVRFLDRKGLAIRSGGVFSQVVFTNRHDTPHSETESQPGSESKTESDPSHSSANHKPADENNRFTAHIPEGGADVLLGVDLLEAARTLEPDHPYPVTSDKTISILNSARTPTVRMLMGSDQWDERTMLDNLKDRSNPDHFYAFNLGDLCERILDTKLYVNIMMLGMAYQMGALPLDLSSIEGAIKETVSKDLDRNIRAFTIGRQIIVRPDNFVVEPLMNLESATRTYRRKINLFRSQYAGRRGYLPLNRARELRKLRKTIRPAMRQMKKRLVPDGLIRDFVIRAYDCETWGGLAYMKQYTRLVLRTAKINKDKDWLILKTVIHQLARVMLIKDELYVATLLTSPEKYRRDRRRFNVNPALGDRISYRHYNHPEFNVFGMKIRFKWRSRDWQLRLLARQKWLRRFLKQWHQQEKDFREWYISLVEDLIEKQESDYDHDKWQKILNLPSEVTGYRLIRLPKMVAAKKQAAKWLSMPDENTTSASSKAIAEEVVAPFEASK